LETFTDQSFRELCDVVKRIYTDPEQVAAIGWDADTRMSHLEGAVIAEIHSRMEEFIGERIEVAERIRAEHVPSESLGESHTRRRREEIINFLRKHRSAGLSHPDVILNQTVQAVVDNWRHEFGSGAVRAGMSGKH
jgi:hypothetical protein